VQGGNFGACLMADPALVARCVAAMIAAVRIPVTVKCRIGIDEQDSEADLERFVTTVADAGCRTFIVHARKAWLQGLSPKENREVPPLDYPRVWRLKEAHPDFTIAINGGISSLDAAREQLQYVDGVMLGRAAYQTPWLLADVDRVFFDSEPPASAVSRHAVLAALGPYVAKHIERGGRLNNVTRHILGLYHGQPRARAFRRFLSEHGVGAVANADVLERAIAAMHAVPPSRTPQLAV
jgi:tRNA-dihydrouridine synthase A